MTCVDLPYTVDFCVGKIVGMAVYVSGNTVLANSRISEVTSNEKTGVLQLHWQPASNPTMIQIQTLNKPRYTPFIVFLPVKDAL